MNASNYKKTAGIVRDPNKKIKVDFERTSTGMRMKEKYLSFFFVKKVVWFIARLLLLIGISFVVVKPYISMIASSFMSPSDYVDVTVLLIPKAPTLDSYVAMIKEMNYFHAFSNTFILSVSSAFIQTLSCCMIGYGLAKFKFKGSKVVFTLVMLTMIIPDVTLDISYTRFFQDFDIQGPIMTIIRTVKDGSGTGVFKFIGGLIDPEKGEAGLDLIGSYFPLLVLSIAGLAFKNGLFIFLFRQFFRGVPDELEESAYIDGSGTFKTFVKIIIPLSVPMLITVFLLSFSWQWTDELFVGSSGALFQNSPNPPTLLVDLVNTNAEKITSYKEVLKEYAAVNTSINRGVVYTAGLMLIAPLVVVYVFCQNFLVQGIERSGLTAD